MGESTGISWADHTYNPWRGCTKVSPACDHCYAETFVTGRLREPAWGPHAQRVRAADSTRRQPFAWDRKAERDGTRPFVFTLSLGDVFDNQVPVEWREELFETITGTPNLIWLLLTKRPQNIERLWFKAYGFRGWPANAAIGTTVEDQTRADLNVPALLAAAAAVKPMFTFLSCEPLLGPIDIAWALNCDRLEMAAGFLNRGHFSPGLETLRPIRWVITGGESGSMARPPHPDWFRGLRDQAAEWGVPFHMKQLGEYVEWTGSESPSPSYRFADGLPMVKVGKHNAGRLLDGVLHDARPQVPALIPAQRGFV